MLLAHLSNIIWIADCLINWLLLSVLLLVLLKPFHDALFLLWFVLILKLLLLSRGVQSTHNAVASGGRRGAVASALAVAYPIHSIASINNINNGVCVGVTADIVRHGIVQTTAVMNIRNKQLSSMICNRL